MPPVRAAGRRVAVLWILSWNDDRVSCAVYRHGGGLEMRVLAGGTTILAEPFEIQPRAMARVRALKRSLQRRGWREAARG